jgi:hypothetical protein
MVLIMELEQMGLFFEKPELEQLGIFFEKPEL